MWATLGDNAGSVLTDQARMKGTLHSVDNRTYVLHEITTSSGGKDTRVRFARRCGFRRRLGRAVASEFAALARPLSTSRPSRQDRLRQTRLRRVRRRNLRLRAALPWFCKLLVWCFMRLVTCGPIHGVAYIPQLMPQGVQASDIR